MGIIQSYFYQNKNVPTNTLLQALYISNAVNKPICLDFWDKNVFIDVNKFDKNKKIIVKNEEEYSSQISKIYRYGTEYIIETEFSIFIVKNGYEFGLLVMRPTTSQAIRAKSYFSNSDLLCF